MAFDHGDTDAVYDRLILPVLRRNAVNPVIINRRESNDDLNNQIIAQLNGCDFCITDLTYARQSVYFEAGYAQRQVEVVYTVRKDHLRRGQPDDLRVHFDLQMKPLVGWSSPTDRTFAKRLERRLRATVLREWVRRRAVDEQLQRDREAFQALPVNERLVTFRRRAMMALRRIGFGLWKYDQPLDAPHHTYADIARSPWVITADRHRGRTFERVAIRALPTLSKRDLARALMYNLAMTGRAPERARLKELAIHNLVFTLRPVSPQLIESELASYARGGRPGQYVHRREGPAWEGGFGGILKSEALTETFNFIDNAKSESELRTELSDLIRSLFGSR